MTEREQRREQPAKAMREGPQPSRYMSEGRLTIVVVALAILTFLGILSETSLNIAYSTLMGEFSISADVVQWLTSGYLLLLSIAIPTSPFMVRTFPTKGLFVTAVALFSAGTVVGALAGSIPQCGFSAAASALFSAGFLAPATLVAVFLATSDEAVPIMLAGGASVQQVVLLLVVKFAIAVIGGYVLRCTVFRKHKAGTDGPLEIEMGDCGCETSPVANILSHTIKTTIFLFVVLFALNMVVHGIGEERVASLMLTNSIFQPLLCAVLGLIPSCAMSVLLSELFVGGTISFGALVAGLSTGAGFGYIVLLEEKEGRHRALPVIAATFATAVIGGTLVQLLIG